ncbi:protein tyrosine/serine/threonine phosphatase [Aureococcus anophagefferens]|nr:protein tyrosine/serine/threonine phosphatase [Aureococcus anophagefferens]
MGAWQVLYLGRSPEDAWKPLGDYGPDYPPFHDASPCACTYDVTVLHCLKGLHKARRFNFFNFDAFDLAEYEHFEAVENGDLNWIVEGKFFAFAGPHDRNRSSNLDGYQTLAPEDYGAYFQRKNVGLIVRLNKPYYNKSKFIQMGADHIDLYYLDGSNPPMRILKKFLAVAEQATGAIGVHCKAGLGRTGTCIGCYCMKHYKFTAAEIIGWMRICRPGSVIGPQQHFMQEMEQTLWQEGDLYRMHKGAPNTGPRPPSRDFHEKQAADAGGGGRRTNEGLCRASRRSTTIIIANTYKSCPKTPFSRGAKPDTAPSSAPRSPSTGPEPPGRPGDRVLGRYRTDEYRATVLAADGDDDDVVVEWAPPHNKWGRRP